MAAYGAGPTSLTLDCQGPPLQFAPRLIQLRFALYVAAKHTMSYLPAAESKAGFLKCGAHHYGILATLPLLT
ncbi:hypothetical protein [Sodalis praecaptivus]|uniref:hypothetical protein n=1 Tax=Sodalis TaxID=84565 RepID=UPI00046CFEC3|nr:hypothetical protein [Sodalis praecaptivus]